MATKKQRRYARGRLVRDQKAAREHPASERTVSDGDEYAHGRKLTKRERRYRNLISTDREFWKKRDHNERELKLRNAKNTRMLFIRYAVSILFFVNLYWFSMLFLSNGGVLSVVPVIQIVLFGAAALETFWTLYRESDYLAVTRWVTVLSMIIDATVVTVTLSLGKGLFFPFFSTGYVGAAAVALALVLKLGVVCKVLRVRDRRDKAYDRYVALVSDIQ